MQFGREPELIVASDTMITQIIPVRFSDALKLKADLESLKPDYADLTANGDSNAPVSPAGEKARTGEGSTGRTRPGVLRKSASGNSSCPANAGKPAAKAWRTMRISTS